MWCPEYWVKPTWSWGKWRKQLTGLMRGLLLMALIGTVRVECRDAWVLMITACSYLACSPIFLTRTYFLQSSQCKPGQQVYTPTRTINQYSHTSKSQTKTQAATYTEILTQKDIGIYRRTRQGILSYVSHLKSVVSGSDLNFSIIKTKSSQFQQPLVETL